jgi:hypothetical protein
MPQNMDQLELEKENYLQELVDNQIPESKTIDYKESLTGNSDSDKKEFLADVSSFANAAGGYLIYGMRENSGIASELCGLESIDADAEIRRLDNIIRDGIKPRIPGVSLWAIPLRTSRDAIIIRIPMSWASPHMVTFKNDSKFYSRNSAGKYQLDVSELRAAFVLSETTTERIRNFRIERLSKIIAGETPVLLNETAKIILHIIPFGAFNPVARFDVSSLASDVGKLQPISAPGWDTRHNFDGYLSFKNPLTYLQVFRNGIIEAVDASIMEPEGSELTIPSLLFERKLLDALPRFLAIQRQLGVEPPLFIILSLLGVSGYTMGVNANYVDPTFTCHPIDRDALLLPKIILEKFDCNPSEVMRPIFDAIWNAAGWPRSMHYNENGERVKQ